jgi:hypothetical protein
MNDRIHPLVRLPQKEDRIIYLLREELKAAWFFNHMNIIGLTDPYHEPSLCTGILAQMGFNACSDELMNFYVDRIHHHIKKLKPEDGPDEFTGRALYLYGELRQMRKHYRAKAG